MAWTSVVKIDVDKTDVGSATAIWNAAQADEFRYGPQRVQLNVAGRNAFVAAAKAALTARTAQAASEATLTSNLTTALNS